MAAFPSNPNLIPSLGSSMRVKTRLIKTSFGDGYEQRVVDGINATIREIPLIWQNLTAADHDELLAFFEAQVGQSFDFTPPWGSHATGKYVCEEWNEAPGEADIYSLSATFRQVFE